ncbi:DNA-binding response regulator, OmpR family, contains REC and winged-helix (wHTH) domain [Hymenobacter gelipurpurascens]|uniref:DNA-binding response regulator, OmpR family, contains REC and winged-helix (WHTH) domain n=1 Tax=Hymenobacter gelipurpurascens TaxID=89968 RepID=A0A212TDI5_9BACT|nr:response regulator transcription factor [Hymenobacter gelipurpurascens]SNC63881.1 DNA-binding response regulator, OmpR family, contains REC and winged-helix (wHTH) domain [Hymenobacter gelipurpurascens]
MHVLIVEDEKSLHEEVRQFLRQSQYLVDSAYTYAEASEKIFVNSYDFVLLDLGLPDGDGLDLLEEARQNDKQEASFIILTARGALDDRIRGLDLGADDYLPKPFSLLELQSRMQAIMRRKFGLKRQEMVFGNGFLLDATGRTLRYNGQDVPLTKKEFDLLHYLLLHKNRVLTRLQLGEHLWGNVLEDDSDSNYIDVHIKNIRKKLSQFAPTDFLETVRGIGYRVMEES